MIVVKSPLRISFVGGGSDLPSYCNKEDGFVVSAAINKYVYVMISSRYDNTYRISYSKTENVNSIRQIEHDIVREALRINVPEYFNRGLEIVSMADLSSGAGLGSSGAFTVGLLKGLHSHFGQLRSSYDLISEASRVEIDLCGHNAGYQDQSASAFGGLRSYKFIRKDIITEDLSFSPGAKELESRIILVDLGLRGPSDHILRMQSNLLDDTEDTRAMASVQSMVNLAHEFKDYLLNGNIDKCGEIVDASWSLKKSIVKDISNGSIDEVYSFAKKNGAIGGKVCGAGGRGLLLLIARQDMMSVLHKELQEKYPYAIVIHPRFSHQGSTIVYSSR